MKHRQKTEAELKPIAEAEGKVFAEAILKAEGPLHHKLYRHFCEEMRRAVDHGRICSPERMTILYPIFREINLETDDINAFWAEVSRREKRRQARKAVKAKMLANA